VGFPMVPKSTTLDDLEPARLSRAYLSVS